MKDFSICPYCGMGSLRGLNDSHYFCDNCESIYKVSFINNDLVLVNNEEFDELKIDYQDYSDIVKSVEDFWKKDNFNHIIKDIEKEEDSNGTYLKIMFNESVLIDNLAFNNINIIKHELLSKFGEHIYFKYTKNYLLSYDLSLLWVVIPK